eukprot:TRINITY_DN1109_c0_g1_i13.p1 TRINITY_DN1109_c0_g1~~TRINITY_DN1109_c0_g1_i13.p1  ORF type:complete len:784 (+),score=236.41 TRINITY_DN1109_c0_g1_i13:121-2472(+)
MCIRDRLKRIKSGYRTLFFYIITLAIYMAVVAGQLGLSEISRFSTSLRALATGRRRGWVLIQGEFFDPPFYNRQVYSVRTFWRWWERFLSSQIFKEDPNQINAKQVPVVGNVTRINNFNDLGFAAVMSIKIGDVDVAYDRGYYESLDLYAGSVMSDQPEYLPEVHGGIGGISSSDSTAIKYNADLGGYPLFVWDAPKSKKYTKFIKKLRENHAEFVHEYSNNITLAEFTAMYKPSDAIGEAIASNMINNRTRAIQLRIPSYNPQLDVVGLFGWDVKIDLAGYWEFRYVQAAMRRDPYVSSAGSAHLRWGLEAALCLMLVVRITQLGLELCGLTRSKLYRLIRHVFLASNTERMMTEYFSAAAVAAQAVVWVVIVTVYHSRLNHALKYIAKGDEASVTSLLTSIDELDTAYKAYHWVILLVFAALFFHLFNILKFQGKLNAISMVVRDTIIEVLWFFTVFFLAIVMFAGVIWMYFGSYLSYMSHFDVALGRTMMMAFSLNKIPDKEIWATGDPFLAYTLMLLFRVVMIVFLLKMVFAIVNTQYKKNRKSVHDKANSPLQDWQQCWGSWYLSWTQRKKPQYVSNRVVLLALDSPVLEHIEEISARKMLEALQDVSWQEQGEARNMGMPHAEWIIAHYAMEVEKRLRPETQKKVDALIQDLNSLDPKKVKLVESNIDFLVAAAAVKPDKAPKDKSKQKPAAAHSDMDSNLDTKDDTDDDETSFGAADTSFRQSMISTAKAVREQEAAEQQKILVKKKVRGTTYDDDKPESDLQKLQRRWKVLSKDK